MNQFDFLPKESVIFLDSSIVDPYCDKDFCNLTSERIKRVRDLRDKLANMDNWIAIPEVIEESRRGLKKLKKIVQHLKVGHQEYKNDFIMQKERMKLRNLFQATAESSPILTSKLEDKMKAIYPRVKEIFLRYDGKTNELETDIKVVAYTLSHAQLYREGIQTCIWTYDSAMLKTLFEIAEKWDIPNLAMISERKRTVIPAHQAVKKPVLMQ